MTATSDQSPSEKAAISPPLNEIVIPTFSIITTISEFDKLQEEWNTLFETHAGGTQLFQTYNWIWHWIHQFEKTPKDIKILTGRINETFTEKGRL